MRVGRCAPALEPAHVPVIREQRRGRRAADPVVVARREEPRAVREKPRESVCMCVAGSPACTKRAQDSSVRPITAPNSADAPDSSPG